MPFNELLTEMALRLDNDRLGSLGEAATYAELHDGSSMRFSCLEPPMESDVTGSGELRATSGIVAGLTCTVPFALTNPPRN